VQRVFDVDFSIGASSILVLVLAIKAPDAMTIAAQALRTGAFGGAEQPRQLGS